ncbi:hypothetical protein DFR29_12625 [Tahibacter aquaticus]|uniref:Carbohydrate esterase 2 N-terminal domain-containing protein n=1 Tax=Tahibacter aquaticus TaxID=520092 RepID=A0A4R6YJ56_9GAMM|nr:hypothetical protein [Tahibacter aquaticus]TDR36989.1 hypothetical protein DFR29_12625 [Tahibacter aquaticus]
MTFVITQNQTGPLPLKIPFTAPISGDVTIAFSGTCWSSTVNNPGGVEVFLDGKSLGKALLFFNNTTQHQALPTQFFAVNLGEGQHTITLQAISSTVLSDRNDFFSLWIVD